MGAFQPDARQQMGVGSVYAAAVVALSLALGFAFFLFLVRRV